MRRGSLVLPFLAVVALLAAASLAIANDVRAQTTGDQAYGAGTFEDWPHCPTGSTTTFDFNATSGASGEDAAGTFSFVCSPTGSFGTQAYSGTVSCLAVKGNEATIGGLVTASTSTAIPVGSQFSFTVVDGGPAGLNDAISVLRQGANCGENYERPQYRITAGDIVVVDATPPAPAVAVVVTPPTAVNEVGTEHTVTATATTATGAPAEGVSVEFEVLNAEGQLSYRCTTDAQGQCTYTYTGPSVPAADLITACADNNQNGETDVGEPCGEATKIWILPVLVSTPGQVTGGGWITSTGGRVSFGFNAKSDDDKINGNCNVIDHATKTQIKCLTVETLVVAGTHATFTGQARVDGAVTNYRIDVDDLGEPGVLDTFKVETDSGYTAGGRLDGGNIQIHR